MNAESVIGGKTNDSQSSYMSTTKSALINFLQSVDNALAPERRITLVAAGDTALALLDLKAPTGHLDFVGFKSDIAEFGRACATISSRQFQIHTWTDGMVFGHQLPDDYLKMSLPVSEELSRIHLRALHPLDIVVSRIERLTESDMRDIKACIKRFKLGKNQVARRARDLQQVGDESKFERNLEYVLALYV